MSSKDRVDINILVFHTSTYFVEVMLTLRLAQSDRNKTGPHSDKYSTYVRTYIYGEMGQQQHSYACGHNPQHEIVHQATL